MKEYAFIIKSGESNQRLDLYLRKRLPSSISRSRIQGLIAEGFIKLNDKPTKPHHKLKQGEELTVIIPPLVKPEIKPEEIPLEIVYEDDQILVVNKPPGLVVHPAVGNYSGTLVNALLHHCKGLSGIGGILKPGIVHRLDKGTSGLLVCAKTDEAHQGLAGQFKAQEVLKKYIAIVKGRMAFDEGVIDEPVGRHPRYRKKIAVVQAGGRSAVTHYRVLERFEDFSLVELKPKTGRTHQIRAHMAYLGHPVVGDGEYGRRSQLIDRQALHAKTLGFHHPSSGQYLEFTIELPEDMRGAIQKIQGEKGSE